MVLDLSDFLAHILSLFSIGILFIFFLFPENYIIGFIFSGYYLVLYDTYGFKGLLSNG